MRYGWIDYLRGICIISIMFCHTAVGSFEGMPGIQEWLNMFMINTFFVLSGILVKDDQLSPREFLHKKLPSLVEPYWIYSGIILIASFIKVIMGSASVKDLLEDCFKAVSLSGIGTLWFLPVLFWAQFIFYYLFLAGVKGKTCFYIGLLGSIIYAIIFQGVQSKDLIFKVFNAPLIILAKSFIAALFLMEGYYFKKLLSQATSSYKSFCIGGVGLVLSFFVGSNLSGYDFNQFVLPNPVLYIFSSSLCALCIVYWVKMLYNIGGAIPIIEWFGKNSLILMCTHYSLLIPIVRNTIDLFGGGGKFFVFSV